MRYAILRHTGHGDTHYDLLLEVAGRESLRTIQLAKWPLAVGESCTARELPPHRRVYLEYEGEISGGRGEVTRVDEGSYESADDGVSLQSSRGGGGRLVIRNGSAERTS